MTRMRAALARGYGAARQVCDQVFCRLRATEIVALGMVAAELLEQFDLFELLNAFGQYLEPQAMT